jgi:hypothetical protein
VRALCRSRFGEPHAITALALQKTRALQPGERPIRSLMGEAEFGRKRFPGSPELTCAVGLCRERMQHVKQPVCGMRQGKPLGPRPLGHEAGRKVCGDAPVKARIDLGRTAQLGRRVYRHEAWGGGDGVAVMSAFERARLGEGIARSRAVEDEAAALRRGACEFQHTFTHQNEPEGGITHPKQGLAMGKAAVAAGRQRLKEIVIHVIAVIFRACGFTLPAAS